ALEMRRARAERRLAGGSAPKADRSARVAKSRGEDVEEAPVEEDVIDEEITDETVDESAGVETEDRADSAEPTGPEEARDFGEQSHEALEDGSMPDGFEIKGNADSMKFHQPGGRWYDNTVAEVWFASAEAAEAAGFAEAGKKAKNSEEEE
ncbi:MAG: 50S ribosomal protein L17, partial [Acidimicrobiales bacterium]